MLMLLRSWTADEAFVAPRGVSQRTDVKVHHVAAIVVVGSPFANPDQL